MSQFNVSEKTGHQNLTPKQNDCFGQSDRKTDPKQMRSQPTSQTESANNFNKQVYENIPYQAQFSSDEVLDSEYEDEDPDELDNVKTTP